ncbi:ABC transporter ATP-binding protein [Kitasatospora viridis]|uniref:ABC-2 type transport system ATP-binding protein n=1 Tax=Kitasatospora viridis TaxID=281105 RepID=A0A561UHX3_9ACTN|nr:ABC transporter ATP-binding protein [Kitasatospora viridis]TWF98934.1 ABC-2 type transport system ATP-binding protein [Kitasatospora viridis]
MTGTRAMVEVEDLRRTFPRPGEEPRVALAGLDLAVPEGEVHGLLGPNGAGKTTLCRILSTVLLPTAGTARVAGLDVVADTAAVRRTVGIVFGGERGLYNRLTARQNLLYWSSLFHLPSSVAKPRVARLLERTGLADRADERVETYSRGMKQRLHLARGLINDPKVVILDEPTVGMDPVAAHDFRALVGELRADGRTLLLTTHDMAEAEAVCDRVSLVDGGRLIGTEQPSTIGRWMAAHERITAAEVPAPVAAAVRALPGVGAVTHHPDGALVVETVAEGATAAVLRHLLDHGVTALSTGRPSLEDVYLSVIGNRGLTVR